MIRGDWETVSRLAENALRQAQGERDWVVWQKPFGATGQTSHQRLPNALLL